MLSANFVAFKICRFIQPFIITANVNDSSIWLLLFQGGNNLRIFNSFPKKRFM